MSRTRRTLGMAALLVGLLGACGQQTPGGPGPTPELRFPRCDELAPISADPSLYRDEPVYVGNEQPIDEVLAWAQGRPAFEDLWIDREHQGWLTVAFSAGAAELQDEIDELFPDDGVVAVQVERTKAELDELAARVRSVMTGGAAITGVGVAIDKGVVAVDLGYLSEDLLALLDPYESEPICISGAPPSDLVEPGAQPTAGAGWRLLGEDLTGEPYRTGVATTHEQYERLWETARMTGEPPAVDLESEIVVWFGAVYGSGCPVRLDDVVVDEAAALVHAEIVLPTNPGACNSDANPHAYVVAVSRAGLGEGPFAVQLGPQDPPVGVPEERTLVDADLSAPGATALDSQIGFDQDLIDRSGRPQPVSSGGYVEVGFPWPYSLEVEEICGVRWLGALNDVEWVSDDAGDEVPQTWRALVEDGRLEVEVLITGGPASLTASAGGTTLAYRPAHADDEPCA